MEPENYMQHSLIGAGNSLAANALGNTIMGQGSYANQIAKEQAVADSSKTLFKAAIEVVKVANGYLVHIGRREGYSYDTHIAATVAEVNEIIAAQIVAFRLEDRS